MVSSGRVNARAARGEELAKGARRARRGIVLAALALGGLASAGCGAVHVQVGVDPLGPSCLRDFGSSTAAAKVETFLAATSGLDATTRALADELDALCVAAGRDARLAEGDLVVPGDELHACRRLVRWIDGRQAAATARGDGSGHVHVEDATCTQSMDAYASCVAQCELRYRADEVEVRCDGTIRDRICEGTVSAAQVSARCRASCDTEAALTAACTTSVSVSPAPTGDSELASVLVRLSGALPGLHARLRRITTAAQHLVQIAPAIPSASATVSVRAVSCAEGASQVAADASVRMERTLGVATAVIAALE